MMKNKTLKLLNTIELSPYKYSKTNYETPKGSISELPNEWNEFWKRCLTDKNLGNLCAIRKGSYLVDIETINNYELEEILINELNEVDLDDYEEQVSRMSGGIVVKVDNISIIEPTCCGDIGNIMEWESIFDETSISWKQLWIGHPWLFYKKENGYIEFSDYTDLNLKDYIDIKSRHQFQEEGLKNEVQKIRKQHNIFEYKIRIILDKLGISNSEHISKLITGNT